MIATPLVEGAAVGRAAVLDAPLSFWGGVDAEGVIIDRHHPQYGLPLAECVLVMPSSRGSSSSSSVLAELIRAGRAPRAIILTEPDAIVVLGALVAAELYRRQTPVVVVAPSVARSIPSGVEVVVASSAATADIRW